MSELHFFSPSAPDGRGSGDTSASGFLTPVDGSWGLQERVGSRLAALFELLDDGDSGTWSAVRRELLGAGGVILTGLRRAAQDPSPRRRARARTLLGILDRRAVMRRLISHGARGVDDLEAALYRLARVDDPRFDARATRSRLDDLADRVRERAAEREPGLDRPHALVSILAGEEGLRGPDNEFNAPSNVHIHRVLESGRGLPLTLVAIYLLTARRAGLHASGVPLPGHVMLRLHWSGRSMLVDPFHRGAVRTRKECLAYLLGRGLAPRPDWFRDADDAALYHRQVLNLANGHRAHGNRMASRDLQRVARAVALGRGLHTRSDPESS